MSGHTPWRELSHKMPVILTKKGRPYCCVCEREDVVLLPTVGGLFICTDCSEKLNGETGEDYEPA